MKTTTTTEEHAKKCLLILRKRRDETTTLGQLRTVVGMTDREADKAMAWLKRRGLAVYMLDSRGWRARTS